VLSDPFTTANPSRVRYATCSTCGKSRVKVTAGVVASHGVARVNGGGEYESDVRCEASGKPRESLTRGRYPLKTTP
jgi:hypothetical protein